MTPLFLAVRHANLPLCRVLVARGANVDLGTDFATTPLMIACRRSQMEIVTFLVENGANINLQNGDGATALMWTLCACCCHMVQMSSKLISKVGDYCYRYFPLIDAANGGSLEVCRLLVEEWAADVNQQTIQERYTPVICAASKGHLAIVNFLVEHGADLQHPNCCASERFIRPFQANGHRISRKRAEMPKWWPFFVRRHRTMGDTRRRAPMDSKTINSKCDSTERANQWPKAADGFIRKTLIDH
ncbi:hypothetical protein niasHT_002452 [Heterodera trifolii]|uniref:Ankyrin repeat protein n=1 Tax=Heterodera trifolii TaxID=157864 RepID=A0ABD2LMG8_9BILA